MIETKIELIKPLLRFQFKIKIRKLTFKESKKHTFILSEEEFIDFYAKMDIVQKQRVEMIRAKLEKRWGNKNE